MLSVALCTYNGARYIGEQIQSILNQTILVDEIVVCDDGSKDNTLNIIEKYKATTSVDIRIYRNETNLGPSKNFQQAISLCHGDIIFLADQDDVWMPNKVDTIAQYFNLHPEHFVVISDATLLFENTQQSSLWRCFGLTKKALRAIDNNFGIELFAFENRATGATMAIRRSFEFLQSIANYCHEYIIHDGVLAMLALNRCQFGYIPQELIQYRIHSNQECGIGSYLEKPVSDDVRDTSFTATLWNQLPLPEPLASRIAFIVNRYRRKNQSQGAFRLIEALPKYRKMYGNYWLSFLYYDLCQWMGNMIIRIRK